MVEQLLELRAAAMHVTDDVEWAVVELAVVPQWLARDLRRGDVALRSEVMHLPKAFTLKKPKRALELTALLPDHVRSEIAIGSILVARLAQPFGKIEHDRDRKHVVPPCQLDQRLPRFRLHI